ncbi:MAG: hypothetical protein H0W73_19815 [Bacteroidetes bacterium]|nr:hypothetical protein [Bacteroidota bacterium]
MKNKNLFLLLFLICASFFLKAQSCSSCSTLISQTDTSDYVVNTGQTLCIDTSGNCLGKITLNGGTVCNKGFFQPKDLFLNGGSLNNLGNLTYMKSLTLNGSVNITIEASSVINVEGDFTINTAGNVTNNGYLNVSGNIQNNGALNNLNVINCLQISGNAAVNAGVINQN